MTYYKLITLFLILFLSGCQALPSLPVYGKISGEVEGCYIGAFVNGLGNISSYETMVGRDLAVVMWYVNWTQDFPTSDCNTVRAHGSVPCITWEPWNGTVPSSVYTLENIINGSFDTYINTWATEAKNWRYPLFLRFSHEMNGNWYPWDGYHNGGSTTTGYGDPGVPDGPEKFVDAWRHVYGIFTQVGATNVTWVWCPNSASTPNQSWNSISNYYPGDDYVDWLGLDGYNWGQSSWSSFNQIFSQAYATLGSLSSKPYMIGEMASAEQGGDKGAWITDAFSKIKNDYTSFKLYNWFNISKERDWRVNSSSESQTAFRSAMNDAYFLDNIPLD